MVASEGDSISVTWGGNYTGMFKQSRSDVEFHGLAVGGSGLADMSKRLPALLDLKPDLVSVFIGANDLLAFPTAQAYADALRSYVGKIQATGAKVVIGTNLPQYRVSVSETASFNERRAELATILRKADWADGLFDFAAAPEMGPVDAARDVRLYSDGVHPTDSTQGVGEGGQAKLFRIYKPVMDPLVKDWR